MQQHPYFDLLLHDNAELSALLQDEILERITLHEWPLSCVQRLTCASGRKAIYKAQSAPSVEPEFYTAARSPLLVAAQTLYREGPYACLLLECVEAPTLEAWLKAGYSLPGMQNLGQSQDKASFEAQATNFGKGLLAQIATIQGQLPYTLDITCRDGWQTYASSILDGLSQLVRQQDFTSVTADDLTRLERWSSGGPVLSTVESNPGYVHHDLNGDNILLLPSGCKLIDWQRPIRGPVQLDLANLLESLGFDARRHVPVEIIQILNFLRIGWFTGCALRWFPAGKKTYNQEVTELCRRIVR